MTQSPLPKGQSGQPGKQQVDQASPPGPPDRPSEVGQTCRAGARQGTGLIRAKKKRLRRASSAGHGKQEDKGQAGNPQEKHRPPTSRFYRTAGRERTANSPSGGGGSGGIRGSGGRVASEDGHRFETSQPGTRQAIVQKILGRRKGAAFGDRIRCRIATRARLRHRIKRRGPAASPTPRVFEPPGAAPWIVEWRRDGAGRPETGGTIHQGVVHPRPPGGPERKGMGAGAKVPYPDHWLPDEDWGGRGAQPADEAGARSQDPAPGAWCQWEPGLIQSCRT